ncbi:MAG: cytochrome c oxidase accessory protein CcoG [Planctomycetales bacterium]|nr:cytochrome c oxidase accessory protein CcoG [Planctomycetales bacterium]
MSESTSQLGPTGDSNSIPTVSGVSSDTESSGYVPREVSPGDALLPAPEHVLSTLERDGRRRWIKPKLSMGLWWHRRRIVAYVLMVIFVVVPHIKVWGKPLIRLDITARQFTVFGHTFYPTDTLLLALLMLSAFLTIVFVTAVTGRAWCGWACPQTVYIEFLFRPIDRLFEGTAGKGGHPKKKLPLGLELARLAVYVFLNMFLAHTFLAFFVGPEKLSMWIWSSPSQHPVAFIVMAVTTGLLTYDFYFFREQTCLIACPYGRFQSVMLDRHSMIVAYDYARGEPREKGKRSAGDSKGHCVDCNQCVVVCPTGIDIRNGLQMECINCTQCIDACDTVMDKVGLPQGLIRYSSQDALAHKPKRLIRARTILYPLLLAGVVSGLVYAISTKFGFDARIVREKGAPFTNVERGVISNSFRLKLVNRSDKPEHYTMTIVSPPATLEVIDESRLDLEPGSNSEVPFTVRFSSGQTLGVGNAPLVMEMADSNGHTKRLEFKILGPR